MLGLAPERPAVRPREDRPRVVRAVESGGPPAHSVPGPPHAEESSALRRALRREGRPEPGVGVRPAGRGHRSDHLGVPLRGSPSVGLLARPSKSPRDHGRRDGALPEAAGLPPLGQVGGPRRGPRPRGDVPLGPRRRVSKDGAVRGAALRAPLRDGRVAEPRRHLRRDLALARHRHEGPRADGRLVPPLKPAAPGDPPLPPHLRLPRDLRAPGPQALGLRPGARRGPRLRPAPRLLGDALGAFAFRTGRVPLRTPLRRQDALRVDGPRRLRLGGPPGRLGTRGRPRTLREGRPPRPHRHGGPRHRLHQQASRRGPPLRRRLRLRATVFLLLV
mmetsp:Transcript_2384/g.8033  ORF Transcript_2384/g.8033 Transcript_2384/m.8033 type:complete len:332 (-) Transcript_2384:2359-3354(-)